MLRPNRVHIVDFMTHETPARTLSMPRRSLSRPVPWPALLAAVAVPAVLAIAAYPVRERLFTAVTGLGGGIRSRIRSARPRGDRRHPRPLVLAARAPAVLAPGPGGPRRDHGLRIERGRQAAGQAAAALQRRRRRHCAQLPRERGL